MGNASKVLFKEIMVFVKEFESLGNKWCEENDISSVARARSYGKKIISAMKPFIEESIKETDAAIAAEAAAKIVVPVVVPVVEEVAPVVEEVLVAPVEVVTVVEDTISAEIIVEAPVVDSIVEPETKVLSEKKETDFKNKGFNFNKRK